MRALSRETRPKAANSAADQISEMLDCFHQRLTVDNPRLAERYSKAEIHLLVHFSVRGVDEQFIAYFQRAEIVGGFHEEGGNGHDAPVHFLEHRRNVSANIEALKTGPHRNKQAVLVDVVQLIDNPEIMAFPSLMGFDSVERIYGILPQSLYFSGRTGFVMVGIGVPIDIERGLFPLARDAAVGANHQEMLMEIIESGPKVLDNIPGYGGDREGNRLNAGNIIDQLSRLRIALSSDSMGVGFAEGVDGTLQIEDVCFLALSTFGQMSASLSSAVGMIAPSVTECP